MEYWYAGMSQFLEIYFRSTSDQHLYGSGAEINNDGNGRSITRIRTASTTTGVNVKVLIVLNAIAKFDGGRFMDAIV